MTVTASIPHRATKPLTRPVLRYYGGKWQLAPWIIQHFPAHHIYLEPFGGAASVLLRKARSDLEIYNDRWDQLVNLFQVLRNPAWAVNLHEDCTLTPYARREFESATEQLCDPMLSVDPIERARLLLVRNWMGHSSAASNPHYSTGFRLSDRGHRSNPATEWHRWPDQIPAITERLQGVTIENQPAQALIERWDSPDTLIYVDPPYVRETRHKAFKTGYVWDFSDDDHKALAETLHHCQSHVVLSGYRCSLLDTHYGDWQRIDHEAFADRRSRRVESIWLNPRAQHQQSQIPLALVSSPALQSETARPA